MKIGRRKSWADTRLRAAKPSVVTEQPYDWGRSSLHPLKGKKDGRCNRTACQEPIGANPELPDYRDQYAMRSPYTSGEELYYCQRCAHQFLNDDARFGNPARVSLYIRPQDRADPSEQD